VPPGPDYGSLVGLELDFLGLLSGGDRSALEAIATLTRLPAGRLMLAEGQAADRVLVLRSGRAKIVCSAPEGGDVVLDFRGPGSLLGEQALVDGSPRAASAIAIEPVEVLVIPASAFRAYLERRPAVAMTMLAMLSRRLRDSDRRLAQFGSSDTLGRVCARLVQLCDEHGEPDRDGRVRVTLPLTQEDLAGWIGASIEATGKSLRTLRELGWIDTGRRAIVVHDLDAVRGRAA
jgi:CRP/FNR family transcriptional regulator, cyclic AMP receptor protein